MLKMIIDNKATATKPYEVYGIDERIYNTEEKVKELAYDCLSDEVYLIRVKRGDKELFTIRNEK